MEDILPCSCTKDTAAHWFLELPNGGTDITYCSGPLASTNEAERFNGCLNFIVCCSTVKNMKRKYRKKIKRLD